MTKRDAVVAVAFSALMITYVSTLSAKFPVPDAALAALLLLAAVAHFAAGYVIGRRRATLLAAVPLVVAALLDEDEQFLLSTFDLVAILEVVVGLPLLAVGVGVRGALDAERRGLPGTLPPRRP